MKNIKNLLLASGGFILSVAAINAESAGFGLYEYSARGDALGGALIARADDPSALMYNPAGITQLEGTQFLLGTAMIRPSGTVNIKGTDIGNVVKNHLVPHFYLTHQFNDNIWFGLSAGTRFGLPNSWGENWLGRFRSYEVDLKTYSAQPTIAYKFNEQFSVALGAEIIYSEVKLGRKIGSALAGSNITTPAMDLADSYLDGDGWGIGGVLGLRYQPNDRLSLGLTARSPIKINYSGDASITQTAYGKQVASMGVPIPNGKFDADASLTLPASIGLGAAYQFNDKFSLEADVVYTFWSSFDELKVETKGAGTTTETKDWENAWRVQLGAEYHLDENWTLRGGYIWDQSPIEKHADFLTFPNDRHIFSAGVGYKRDNWSVDVSYGYVMGANETFYVDKDLGNVDYKSANAHLFNISFGYSF